MKFGAALIGLSLLAASSSSALADATFGFTNVTLYSSPSAGATSLGTLTGTFTTNDALSAILSYDITASPVGSFLGFHYVPTNSAVTAATLPSQYFQIDSTGNQNELRIYFASPLTRAGAAISAVFSYEHEPSGGNRFPSGRVDAVATPGPIAGAGLPALIAFAGLFGFRRWLTKGAMAA